MGFNVQKIDPSLAIRIVRTSKVIAYDTETSGLNSIADFICGYVITDKENSIYVPVRHEAGGNIPDVDEFEAALRDAFAERSRLGLRTVGHHLGFDLRFSLKHGVVLGSPLEDTMINESLIDDRTRGYGLDDCCTRHQVAAKKGADLYRAIAEKFGGLPDRKQMGNFWRMPGDDHHVVDYATGDGISTLALWESQQPILDDEELRVPWQLECDLLPYVARMHRRGMRIDPEYGEQVNGLIAGQIDEANKRFSPGFNARAPSEVEALYRANGYDDSDFARTATGKVSFTEKWLETNGIGDAILSVRRLEKARDSFVKPLVEIHNYNGRVHPVLHQSKSDEYGVAGSRFSCSDPNLQAFPKRNKKVGRIVRQLVVPDEGMLLEEGDAMQQEPRLFSAYSRDEALLKGYREDPFFSIHHRANDMMFDGQEYDKAKRMAMGILSMMYPKTLSGHLDISVKEAQDLRNRFLYDAFPAIGQFQNDVVSVFEKRGYVKSILGRKARLESRRFAYQGVSRVIQNSGGDHIKTCVLRACQYEDAYPDKLQILLSIHDSVLWQRDPGHCPKEFIAILENVPHEPQFNRMIEMVPIPFEVGSGHHWTEASYDNEIKGKGGWKI
jgi:DNA polymerase I